MKDYVIINGVSSKTKTGLAINILPPITKPEMRTLVEEIDGRDGDIITKLGYSAYDKTIEIGLFGNGYDVDDIIAFFNQEGTIIFSNEPTKYYNFTLVDSFDIERLLQFKTSTITFHCQPFKYEVGETPKEIEYDYVSGEGTEITLNNTMNALMELELNPSELTQETTLGTNYFNAYAINTAGIDVTNDGATITMPIVSTGGGYTSTGKKLSVLAPNLQVGDNVYIYFTCTSTNNKTIYTTDGTYWASSANKTITQAMLDGYVVLYSNNATQGETSANVYSNLRIVKTQSAPFEKYSGGIPAPNPEFPSEVQVIKGNNSIKIENKNLLPSTVYKYAIQTTGLITSNNDRNAMYCEIIGGNTYHITRTAIGTASYFWYGFTDILPANNVQCINFGNMGDVLDYTVTAPANAKYLVVFTGSGVSTNTMVSFAGGDYVVHQEQFLIVDLSGKNKFDVTEFEKQLVAGKILDNNGVETNDNISTYSKYMIPVKANQTYAIKGWFQRLYYYNSNGDFISRSSGTNNIMETTYTPTSNGYLGFQISNSNWSANKGQEQVEIGNASTSYQAYTTLEYCKIGTYEDEFEHDGDKWYLNKYIGKVVLDGSESWNTSNGMFYTSNNLGLATDGITMIADYFAGATNRATTASMYNNNPDNSICGATSGTGNYYVKSTQFNDANTFKTWLLTHNTTVYRVLATPTHTEITDSTLINQLNAIEKAVSYDEQTNISQVNTGLPFRIKATAMISGSDSVEITNNGNVYAKPILDIKGTGIINVYLNGTQMFSVDITDEIIVDIPNLETYNPNTSALMNRNVTGNISNFIIPAGTNTITVDGAVEKVTITMYQRWL